MNADILSRFAKVIIKSCINIQEGQQLIIKAIPEAYEFVRYIVKEAYLHGACFVTVDYGDEHLSLMRITHSKEDSLTFFPKWYTNHLEATAKENIPHIIIKSPAPALYKNVPLEKIRIFNRSLVDITPTRTYDYLSTAFPTIEWASAVYPDLSPNDAIDTLWHDVITILHLYDTDPSIYWDNFKIETEKKRAYLDNLRIEKLILRSPQTNLEVGLIENCNWIGGYYINDNGIKIMPNLPTQEIFTSPHKYKVNGNVTTTIPLNYNGVLIDNVSMEFKDGKIVSFSADKGLSTLADIINTDQGSCYIGEIAMVDVSSSIYQSGKIFHTTLYDENAVCHMALGMSIPSCVNGSSKLSSNDKNAIGLNTSRIHIDFMIGSDELDIDAISKTGEVISLMRNGKYMF